MSRASSDDGASWLDWQRAYEFCGAFPSALTWLDGHMAAIPEGNEPIPSQHQDVAKSKWETTLGDDRALLNRTKRHTIESRRPIEPTAHQPEIAGADMEAMQVEQKQSSQQCMLPSQPQSMAHYRLGDKVSGTVSSVDVKKGEVYVDLECHTTGVWLAPDEFVSNVSVGDHVQGGTIWDMGGDGTVYISIGKTVNIKCDAAVQTQPWIPRTQPSRPPPEKTRPFVSGDHVYAAFYGAWYAATVDRTLDEGVRVNWSGEHTCSIIPLDSVVHSNVEEF